MRLVGATALAAVLLIHGVAHGVIQMRGRTDAALGRAPSVLAALPGRVPLVLVVNDEGLSSVEWNTDRWGAPVPVAGGEHADRLAVGDLDGDGYPEVAFTLHGERGLEIVRGTADGLGDIAHVQTAFRPRFLRYLPWGGPDRMVMLVAHSRGVAVLRAEGKTFRLQPLLETPYPNDIQVVDLNGDEYPDLLLVDSDHEKLLLFEGLADGGARAAGELDTIRGVERALVIDVNGDGRRDVVVGGEVGLAVHFRLGSEGFTPPRLAWEVADVADLAAADLDGDGWQDLAVVHHNRGAVSFLFGSGRGTFGPPRSYAVGRNPTGVALMDFNGDGVLDALVLSPLNDSMTVLRGTGHGYFDGVPCALGVAEDLDAVATADFNRDSKLDVAATSEDSGTVTLFLGDGRGGLSAQAPFPVGRGPRGIVAGRFDADDAPDLAVANYIGDEVAVLLGNGRGQFDAPILVPVGFGPTAIAAGSFRSPDRIDLAIANSLSDSVSILYGDGRGRFPEVVNRAVNVKPSFLIVGDVDRNGHADLIVGSDHSRSVAVLHGTDKGLGVPVQDELESVVRPSLAEDFDGDGRLDLVVLDSGNDAVEILPGTGPGQFGAPLSFTVATHPHAVASGDFDGDGRVDLVVVHRDARILSLLRNVTGEKRSVTGDR